MSAKLLYSMSEENQNLKKQIGCMNGLLQFFDPHHFINNRVISNSSNRRISPGENKQHGRAGNNANKKSKEKHRNVVKEMEVTPIESSRLSISSSGSTAISSSEYEWTTKSEQSLSAETVGGGRHSWDYRANQPQSLPQQPSSPVKMGYHHKKHIIRETAPSASPISTASLISTASREVKCNYQHMDSPRLSHTSRPDSPRVAALNESFRSISSNHSAPVATPRKKDLARLSYDGRETRDNHISSLKVKDLPRLSLDSKQRTVKVSSHESKDDLLPGELKREICGPNKFQSDQQEPTSYRAPSNVVAKLMGLEALPDDTTSNKSRIEQDGSNYFRNAELFSRSSRTIDENKVDRVLHSPRSNCKESRTPRSNKAKSDQTASLSQEADSEPKNHPLTVYGAIEKRLADLDFQKSGKDLRALKQILDSMHKEKNKSEIRKENQYPRCASQTSNSSSVQDSPKHPKKATPSTSKGFNTIKDATSAKNIKPTKLVKGSREETTQVVQDIPVISLQRLRIIQPVDGPKDSAQKKAAKDPKETHHIRKKYSGERTPRPIRTSKTPEQMAKANATSSTRISDARSTTGTTSVSKLKQSQQAMSFLPHNRKLPQGSSFLQETDGRSSEFSNETASPSQQGNTNPLLYQNNRSMVSHIQRCNENANESCMKYETMQQVSGDKNSEGIRGDAPLEEIAITVREQPSPVSVLDANFFDDETPSPVRKKPTPFRDLVTNATYKEAEWMDTDPSYSVDSMRAGFIYGNDYQKLENFKELAPTVWNMNTSQNVNLGNAGPLQNSMNLEKSYVSEIISASGFINHLKYTTDNHIVLQSQEAINPNLFFVLEQAIGSSFISDKRSNSHERITRTTEMHRRRLLFDAVNEILSQKLSQPRSSSKLHSELTTSGPQLLQEIFKEIDRLQPISLPQNLDDEEDFLTTIIGKDLTHRSADWTDVSGETPALVLDIERLIFKDLIVELVEDKATEVQSQKY
ncbi:protein LONGIFOLIA 1-like [Chenopodium quinoa]|uniref:DUF4378 domain-containing protein n=1 Tax=Chenopodium quinoa TaxID=63459 RepID=A0A803N151_CHEQI|nr:protein LONGIFOLIA 1-like [Chenopodium quinoa]